MFAFQDRRVVAITEMLPGDLDWQSFLLQRVPIGSAESSAIPLNSLNFASYSAMLSDLKWNVSIDTLRKFQMTTNDIAHDVYAMKSAVRPILEYMIWVQQHIGWCH